MYRDCDLPLEARGSGSSELGAGRGVAANCTGTTGCDELKIWARRSKHEYESISESEKRTQAEGRSANFRTTAQIDGG
ncbi:cellulose binding domain-containing protein [Sesbania bispinosa]|nr:cellulose binding domain-containing protein [Sesbania bispinosa]